MEKPESLTPGGTFMGKPVCAAKGGEEIS